jgi:hypothetical protein
MQMIDAKLQNTKKQSAQPPSTAPPQSEKGTKKQTAQDLAAQVPPEVKNAIMNSVNASDAPSADDKTGGFHEEGGLWGTTANGSQVPVPALPGPASDPAVDSNAHIFTVNPANPALAGTVTEIQGQWHVHPSGSKTVDNKTFSFNQSMSPGDKSNARFGINIVVGAGDRKVHFYNSSGLIGKAMNLKDFMGQ